MFSGTSNKGSIGNIKEWNKLAYTMSALIDVSCLCFFKNKSVEGDVITATGAI